MEEIKLLHPFTSGSMGIYFPVGESKHGGTCDNASEKCLNECLSIKAFNSDFYVSDSERKKAQKFFQDKSVKIIVAQILKELEKSESKIISWFVSGDCPGGMEKKILDIINKLSEKNIAQRCIIRNRYLFDNIELTQNLRIILAVDLGENNIVQYLNSKLDSKAKVCLYTVPNYGKGRAEIFKVLNGADFVISCDQCFAGYMRNQNSELNCKFCFENKKGCFIEMDNKWIGIAKSMMKEIMYDNGAVDINHPEKYPEKWVEKISIAAVLFFEANPKMLTNEDIENICCGELGENQEKYGKLEGYKELDKVLNDYHDPEPSNETKK